MVSTAVVMKISLQKITYDLFYRLMNYSLSICIEWTKEENARGGTKKHLCQDYEIPKAST